MVRARSAADDVNLEVLQERRRLLRVALDVLQVVQGLVRVRVAPEAGARADLAVFPVATATPREALAELVEAGPGEASLTVVGGHVRWAARRRGIPYVVQLHGGGFKVPEGEVRGMLAPTRRTLDLMTEELALEEDVLVLVPETAENRSWMVNGRPTPAAPPNPRLLMIA